MEQPLLHHQWDDIEPHNLETELRNYWHNYTVSSTSRGCAATYNLTLPNVSVEYNARADPGVFPRFPETGQITSG